jgi:hypothetical protein
MGGEVEAVGGPVCVAVEPKIHACLATGAKLRIGSVGAPERRVELVAGRVGIALAPLPAGEHFAVVTNGVYSTAVGTAYSVELLAGGAVETIVHEGKVAVGAEHGADVVTAHKIGLANGPEVAIVPLEDHARTETPEWAALASVAGRSIEATPLPIRPAEPPAEPGETEAPSAPNAAPVHRTTGVQQPKAAESTTAPAPASASELLATARQALRDQRWADAASAYGRIVSDYPTGAEAHTVLVPLARVELDRLGRAGSAVAHTDAYLASGGPLDVEAELLKIRALKSLGRTADEATAIDRFLSSHPNNLEAEKLRAERAALGTH